MAYILLSGTTGCDELCLMAINPWIRFLALPSGEIEVTARATRQGE